MQKIRGKGTLTDRDIISHGQIHPINDKPTLNSQKYGFIQANSSFVE